MQILIEKLQAGEALTEDEVTMAISTLKWIRDNNPWADSEVQALIDKLKEDCRDTTDKAVAEATIPLIADNDVLKIQNKDSNQRVLWTGASCFVLGLLIGGIAFGLSH